MTEMLNNRYSSEIVNFINVDGVEMNILKLK